MKAVILAGGLGTRLSEETQLRPKPMVEVGGFPIIWHIMKLYGAHGIHEFIICCGYRGYMLKEYFANYFLHHSDVTIDLTSNTQTIHHNYAEPWKITLVDTGANTMTGGRLRRVRDYLQQEDAFHFTYGDGVSNVDITQLAAFHRSHGKQATVTAVRPMARYGALDIVDQKVEGFIEKPVNEGGFINGGFFVLSPQVIDRIASDQTPWETEPLEQLTQSGELMAYQHDGFWQPMDTLRDKLLLERYWESGRAPWKVW